MEDNIFLGFCHVFPIRVTGFAGVDLRDPTGRSTPWTDGGNWSIENREHSLLNDAHIYFPVPTKHIRAISIFTLVQSSLKRKKNQQFKNSFCVTEILSNSITGPSSFEISSQLNMCVNIINVCPLALA